MGFSGDRIGVYGLQEVLHKICLNTTMANIFIKKQEFRRNEEITPLQICWDAATIINFFIRNYKEYDLVDIVALCNEIQIKFLAAYERSQLTVASQLMFGVLRIFQAQVDSCLRKCENLVFKVSTLKKGTRKEYRKHVESDDFVEATPEIPEISEIDIFSLLEKDIEEDTHVIEEIDFAPDQTDNLSFQFSNNAELDDLSIQEELTRNLQQISGQVNYTPPRHSTGSPLHEKVPPIDAQSPTMPDNERVMDHNQTSPNVNNVHDMQGKLLKTPIRRTRQKLRELNDCTPESARTALSPLPTRDIPSYPKSPLFAVSPVFARKKKPLKAFGRDVTITEPITSAALPTDSPQQSRLPTECATPPRMLPASMSPSENLEVSGPPILQSETKNEESILENDKVIESSPADKSTFVPEDKGNIYSFSQSTGRSKQRSQKVTSKADDNIAGRRRRAKKRSILDSEIRINEEDFIKNLDNPNFLTNKKEKVLVKSIVSSQLSAGDMLLSATQTHGTISNRLMHLYKWGIQVPNKKSAKERAVSKRLIQQLESQNYKEAIRHQSPVETVVEENMESQQNNQYVEDDDMIPQDNVLNKQCSPVQTDVRAVHSNEDNSEIQDNVSNTVVSTSHISAQVNSRDSSELTEPVEVASPNTINEQQPRTTASPSFVSNQSNLNQSLEPPQRKQINVVTEEAQDRQEENAEVLHEAKRFKLGKPGLRINSIDHNIKSILFLTHSEFYARVQAFWKESIKLNRRKNGKIVAVFQEIVSPEFSNVYEVIKYLLYCYILERDRNLDLEQEKPYASLYLLQRNE